MNELTLDYGYEELNAVEESTDVGSYNHSAVQANLAYLMKRIGRYSVVSDLSLDVSGIDLTKFDVTIREEIKPDVCIYPKRKIQPTHDILKMREMPLLAIEILSPKQGLYEILEKFKVYFALGIKSCWLVIPNTQAVTVYSSPDLFSNFFTGEVIDPTIGVQVPIEDIFD